MSVLGPVFRSQFHFPSDKVGLCILIEMWNGSGRVDLGHVLTNTFGPFFISILDTGQVHALGGRYRKMAMV